MYAKYVNDGYAKTFNTLFEAKLYVDAEQLKECIECVGHIQKWIGS